MEKQVQFVMGKPGHYICSDMQMMKTLIVYVYELILSLAELLTPSCSLDFQSTTLNNFLTIVYKY